MKKMLLPLLFLCASCDALTAYRLPGTYVAQDGTTATFTASTVSLGGPGETPVAFDYTVQGRTVTLGDKSQRGLMQTFALAFNSITFTVEDSNTLTYKVEGWGNKTIVYHRKP